MSATNLDVRHVITGPVIEVSVQSVVYGIYVALIVITTYTIVRKGLQSKINIAMLFISLFMFTMSSVVLALSLASFIETFSGPGQMSEGRFHALSGSAAVMFVVNLILSDSVMVWRASLLWAGSKIVVVIILGFLGATTASAIMFVGCTGKIFKNTTLCNYASYDGLVLSFTTNFMAMLLIAITAWRHRLLIRATFGRSERKRGEKMLLLLVESNVLYCSTLMIPFACLFIWPGLGDFDGGTYLWPMTTHISGIYPTLLLLLVTFESISWDSLGGITPSTLSSVLFNSTPDTVEGTGDHGPSTAIQSLENSTGEAAV